MEREIGTETQAVRQHHREWGRQMMAVQSPSIAIYWEGSVPFPSSGRSQNNQSIIFEWQTHSKRTIFQRQQTQAHRTIARLQGRLQGCSVVGFVGFVGFTRGASLLGWQVVGVVGVEGIVGLCVGMQVLWEQVMRSYVSMQICVYMLVLFFFSSICIRISLLMASKATFIYVYINMHMYDSSAPSVCASDAHGRRPFI